MSFKPFPGFIPVQMLLEINGEWVVMIFSLFDIQFLLIRNLFLLMYLFISWWLMNKGNECICWRELLVICTCELPCVCPNFCLLHFLSWYQSNRSEACVLCGCLFCEEIVTALKEIISISFVDRRFLLTPLLKWDIGALEVDSRYCFNVADPWVGSLWKIATEHRKSSDLVLGSCMSSDLTINC